MGRSIAAATLFFLVSIPGCTDAPHARRLTGDEEQLFFAPLQDLTQSLEEQTNHLLDRFAAGALGKEYRQTILELVNLGPDAIPYMGERFLEVLSSDDQSVASAYFLNNICEVMNDLEDPRSEPYLILALGHPVEFVRMKGMQGLTRVATSASLEAVLPFLRSENASAARTAMQVLLRIDSPKAHEAVFAVIRDLPSIEMTNAMEKLAESGYAAVLPLAQELLESDGPIIRLAAAKALLDLGYSEALSVLEEGLKHPDFNVSLNALKILARRKEATVARILTRVYDESDRAEMRRIAAIGLREGGQATWETLIRMRDDSDASIRLEVNRGLAATDLEGARELLLADLRSSEFERRHDAIRAYRHIDDPEGKKALIEAYSHAASTEEAKFILTSLYKSRAPEAVPLFLAVIQNDKRKVDEHRTLSDVAVEYAPLFRLDLLPELKERYQACPDLAFRHVLVQIVSKTWHTESIRLLGELYALEEDPGLRLVIRQAARSLRENAAQVIRESRT